MKITKHIQEMVIALYEIPALILWGICNIENREEVVSVEMSGVKIAELCHEVKMRVKKIAELCHEVNRAYCASIGDMSQKPWKEAPDWQRESIINGVAFHLEAERDPEDSHNKWMAEKAASGWKHGAVKDEAKKEHPCMVPFNDLPKEQRAKDHIFKAICDFFRKNW
jgi:hypothetical protein